MDGLAGILFSFSPCVRSLAFLRETRGSTPSVFCMVAMGVLFIVPSMVLRPMFCTWSSLLMWVLAAVAHVPAFVALSKCTLSLECELMPPVCAREPLQ